MLNVVIFGAPGSGMETQSELIIERIRFGSYLYWRCIAWRDEG